MLGKKQNRWYVETLFNHDSTDEWQAKTLEQNGQEIWTGNSPLIMLSPGMCKAEDLRKLAADGRLNDEFVNIVPVLGDHEDVKEYLLPTFVMELVREARYEDLDTWAAKIPKQAKRWAFGIHESGHWMAVRIDWVQRLIQHYDPMRQGATARSRLTLKSAWRLEKFDGPFQAKDDSVNCGVYVTWVLRHWIRGNDLDAASLTCPFAFKMEILRLLRTSPTIAKLPSVGEDDVFTDSFCSEVPKENMHTAIHYKGEDLRSDRRERHSACLSLPRPLIHAGQVGEVILGLGSGDIESVVAQRLLNDSEAPGEAGTHTQHATRRNASVPSCDVTSAGAAEVGDVRAPFPLNLPEGSVDGLGAYALDGAPRFAGDPESVPLTPFLEELSTVDWVNFLERVDWDQFVDIS
ncbi:hypothetical protein LTR86_011108 [Recurvomyces mirabilis]|nr:hypothetical protein LTR86_011108 [Recurvomyces mirabilis]